MLVANTGERYPGAFFVGAAVVTEVECCLAQSVQLLAAAAVAAGVAYSIVEGKIFMEIGAAELLDECKGEAPTIATLPGAAMVDGVSVFGTGLNYGVTEGEVWVGDAASFASSVLLVESSVDIWTPTRVDFTPIQGAFGLSPPPVWVYFLNACGRPNLVGFPATWVAP